MSSDKSKMGSSPRMRARGQTIHGSHPGDIAIRRERYPYASRGPASRFREWLGGSSIASSRALHERLSKRKALAVFSSDALSSVAYATQEILLQLIVLGSITFIYAGPIALLIALLLIIVAISYRQTIKAYPTGGGSFIVARENLGTFWGLIAGASILIDYVLTVAVSVSSGVAAIASAFPSLRYVEVPLAIGFVLILSVMNWRGLRESSSIFAVPTYAFVTAVAVLILTGLVRYVVPGWLPATQAIPATTPHESNITQLFYVWVLLKAFSSGCTALTGIEAIADGVPAFKPPESQNASRTLTAMVTLLVSMFLGITALSRLYPVAPTEDGETVLSQIGNAVFHEWYLYPAYLFLQISTTFILLLAANTAFADFPRISAIIARAGFMPRIFVRVGHRLVFSTGIFVLALAAIIMIILFEANTHHLIPLYAVGVFISFTLSQAGMVARWRKLREAGWQRNALVNTVGAITTFIVLVVLAASKFVDGAWMVIGAIPLIVYFFTRVKRHYDHYQTEMHVTSERPMRKENIVLVPIFNLSRATARALLFAQRIAQNVTAIYVTQNAAEGEQLKQNWQQIHANFPLLIEEAQGRTATAILLAHVDRIEAQNPNANLVIVLPELAPTGWLDLLRHHRSELSLKVSLLLTRPRHTVINVPYQLDDIEMSGSTPYTSNDAAPATTQQNVVIIPIARVDRAIARTLSVAHTLSSEVVAVFVAENHAESEQMRRDWDAAQFKIPLDIIESPYRTVTGSLVKYLDTIATDRPEADVVVILTEIAPAKRWHLLLHNQTAQLIKLELLLTRPKQIVASVPFVLTK